MNDKPKTYPICPSCCYGNLKPDGGTLLRCDYCHRAWSKSFPAILSQGIPT